MKLIITTIIFAVCHFAMFLYADYRTPDSQKWFEPYLFSAFVIASLGGWVLGECIKKLYSIKKL